MNVKVLNLKSTKGIMGNNKFKMYFEQTCY